MRRRSGRPSPVTVITEAEPSHTDQLRTRQKRYLIMMGTRIVCLVVAAVAYSLKAMWAVPVCIVGMVVLPWMAVLIANDRPPLRDRRLPRTAGRPTGDRAIEAADRERVIDQ